MIQMTVFFIQKWMCGSQPEYQCLHPLFIVLDRMRIGSQALVALATPV